MKHTISISVQHIHKFISDVQNANRQEIQLYTWATIISFLGLWICYTCFSQFSKIKIIEKSNTFFSIAPNPIFDSDMNKLKTYVKSTFLFYH